MLRIGGLRRERSVSARSMADQPYGKHAVAGLEKLGQVDC